MIRATFGLLALILATALPARAEIDIQDITTPGGIDAWLVEEHSLPFATVEFRFRGGTTLDPEGKLGAINLMTALLEEGSGELDARAYERALDDLATSIGFDADFDAVSVSAKFLTENREESVALLRDALNEPRFDPDAVERTRAQVLSILREDLTNPEEIASNQFYDLLYGDHPYARTVSGTVEDVSALTRDDLVAAHSSVFARDRVYVAAVGDITPDQLADLIDTVLGDLPETGAELPPKVTPNTPGGVEIIEFDTPQSVVRFAQPGIYRDDPDFFAAYALNFILGGGGFESLLMDEVREKRGLAYGVYSYIGIPDLTAIWAGGTASANDRVAETVGVIRDVWTQLSENGVTEEQLNDAKTYLTGAYPLRFDGNGPIARILVNMQVDGLPIDYVTTRNDKIEAITLEQINRVARERLDPEQLTFVVVGKPEKLDDTIGE